ncbi:hypothetical protein HZH68_012442 [Vespula germanica]|uniref:Uncharacterized protein n=1 Tax=Vespula germanica TaxID=30212 RepID=A0A834MX44_VESGE|nr:hypothetical protein HZH68_012442 [Vespula germanica]
MTFFSNDFLLDITCKPTGADDDENDDENDDDDDNDDDNDDGGKTAVALTLLNALLATIYRITQSSGTWCHRSHCVEGKRARAVIFDSFDNIAALPECHGH